MAIITPINIGSAPNDGTWDTIRESFNKTNTNIDNLNTDKVETSDYTDADVKTKYESNADTNAFTDAEKTKLGWLWVWADMTKAVYDPAGKSEQVLTVWDLWDTVANVIDVLKVTADVSPAIVNTHYLVDANSGNVTISLPNVTSWDTGIFQVTLEKDTNKCTITTVWGTQIIWPDGATEIINHTVGSSLFFSANGVDGYDIVWDSREYYRIIDLTWAWTTDLSTIWYESGSIYNAMWMAAWETRTIIIPDDPSDFLWFWTKVRLEWEGTVVLRTLSSNEINGNTEIDITNDWGGVEIASFWTEYGIVQDSRPKVQNVWLTFYSLGEDSAISDPDVGFTFYKQSCNSIDDARFDQVTPSVRSISWISGDDIYWGGLVWDEWVIGGILPEWPVTSTGNFRKTAWSWDFSYYVEYYKYESWGTETLLATSTTSQTITSSTAAGYTVTATIPETTFSSTDRLLRKIYLNKVGWGSNPTAEFSAEWPIPSFSQVSIGASSITHNSLWGLQEADNGVTYWHITDQAQTIYWDKTFNWTTSWITKTMVGLGNVDNTSDSTKNSATSTLTNKTIDLTDNTVTGTKSEFDTALSDDSFAYLGQANIFTENQTINWDLTIDETLFWETTDQRLVLSNSWGTDLYYQDQSIRLWGNRSQIWAWWSEILTVADNGRVWIDVSAPLTKFHLQADANSDVMYMRCSGWTNPFWFLANFDSNRDIRINLRDWTNTGTVQFDSNWDSYFNGGNVFIWKTSWNSAFWVSWLPTSSAWLSSGDFWNNSNVVNIV